MGIPNTIGCYFIGTILACALWGISCVQTWLYFSTYSDHIWLKLLVVSVWLSDTIHQFLITQMCYVYFVSNFGSETKAHEVLWSVYVEVIFNAITSFLVQAFFIMRIWQISHKHWVIWPIVILIFLQLAASIAYVCQGIAHSYWTYEELKSLKVLSVAVNILTAVSDVVICFVVSMWLNHSKTGSPWSNRILNRLMLFAISSGLLTSVCAICSLVTILALPNTLVYFVFYYIIGRLYSNSLLATLNARNRIREGDAARGSIPSVQIFPELETRASGMAKSSIVHRLKGAFKPHSVRELEADGVLVHVNTITEFSHPDPPVALQTLRTHARNLKHTLSQGHLTHCKSPNQGELKRTQIGSHDTDQEEQEEELTVEGVETDNKKTYLEVLELGTYKEVYEGDQYANSLRDFDEEE